jgi:hypothetical protein
MSWAVSNTLKPTAAGWDRWEQHGREHWTGRLCKHAALMVMLPCAGYDLAASTTTVQRYAAAGDQ